MHGRICLVTGATDGIGRMTARALARDGARVILVGRNQAKGAGCVAALRAETGNDAVGFERADLAAQGEVRALAGRLVADLPRLDVLVNNVGAWFHRRIESPDGIEMTWALNHLGQFLLTGLGSSTSSARPTGGRIVNVASRAHLGPPVDFDDPEGTRRYAGLARLPAVEARQHPLHLPPRRAAGGGPGDRQLPPPGLRREPVRAQQLRPPAPRRDHLPAPLRDQRGKGRRDQPLPRRRRGGGRSERALLRQVPCRWRARRPPGTARRRRACGSSARR